MIWGSIDFQDGKGTWCVDMPIHSANGWNPQIWGSSMVKWVKRTYFVHFHCSAHVGTLCSWILYLRK